MSELDLSHGKYINKNWISESTQIFMPMSGISKTFRDEILENSENDILLSNKRVISMDGSDVSVILFGYRKRPHMYKKQEYTTMWNDIYDISYHSVDTMYK